MIRRFHFRLERILSIRRRQEEQERMRFGAAMQAKLQAEMRLEEIRNRMRETIEAAARMMESRVTIEDLRRTHDYRMALLRRESEAESALAEAVCRLETARTALIEARKKKRVLERLRERAHARWRYESENEEQNDLDEIGLATHIRKQAAIAAEAVG